VLRAETAAASEALQASRSTIPRSPPRLQQLSRFTLDALQSSRLALDALRVQHIFILFMQDPLAQHTAAAAALQALLDKARAAEDVKARAPAAADRGPAARRAGGFFVRSMLLNRGS
jgi:hypothetical protein